MKSNETVLGVDRWHQHILNPKTCDKAAIDWLLTFATVIGNSDILATVNMIVVEKASGDVFINNNNNIIIYLLFCISRKCRWL